MKFGETKWDVRETRGRRAQEKEWGRDVKKIYEPGRNSRLKRICRENDDATRAEVAAVRAGVWTGRGSKTPTAAVAAVTAALASGANRSGVWELSCVNTWCGAARATRNRRKRQ